MGRGGGKAPLVDEAGLNVYKQPKDLEFTNSACGHNL